MIYIFPRDTDSNVTLVHEALKLEGPRAYYVINYHSEQVDSLSGAEENA